MPLAQALRSCYWRIVKPTTLGVRAILTHDTAEVVLVQHSYASGWYLPGGKVKRGEAIIDALWRELREEVGLSAQPGPPTLLGLYASVQEAKRDHIAVFVVNAAPARGSGRLEVLRVKTFPLDGLPENVSPGTSRRLEEFRGNRPIDFTW
ncbi:MAG: NUDIX domain-containing protein [Egibacteraceae bacterium]